MPRWKEKVRDPRHISREHFEAVIDEHMRNGSPRRVMHKYAKDQVRMLGEIEAESIATYTMYRAAINWNPAAGSFATYMITSIRRALRRAVAMKMFKPMRFADDSATEDGFSPLNFIVDPHEPPEESTIRGEVADVVREAIARVAKKDARWAFVLKARYGMIGGIPMTLAEIGKTLGVSRERVRQVMISAVRRFAKEVGVDESQISGSVVEEKVDEEGGRSDTPRLPESPAGVGQGEAVRGPHRENVYSV